MMVLLGEIQYNGKLCPVYHDLDGDFWVRVGPNDFQLVPEEEIPQIEQEITAWQEARR